MAAKAFRETLKTNDFIVTAEVGPTKGSDTTKIIEYIGSLRDKVHALNATDNKSSVMRFPSIGSCLLIKELGGEAVMDVTCRDRNRLAIQADLLFAWSRGIGNVLCITGDAMEYGDDRQAKPVFDIDCIQLIRLVQSLNSGKDMGGNELTGATNFCIGITTTPRANSDGTRQISLERKLEAGVDFILTQAVYDLEDIRKLMTSVRKLDRNVKVLAGIMPLVSVGMGRYMNSNMPGIFVPDSILTEMSRALAGKAILTGISIAARMINQIKEEKICDGVHIMFPGREERIHEVLEAAGLS
ncbi:MAG: methylenetetrahydrofolate reductase [Dehalococcoidia bacterium]|nr:methylenetetrahydrofolate reductase [Dehalococcoidia bacterium]